MSARASNSLLSLVLLSTLSVTGCAKAPETGSVEAPKPKAAETPQQDARYARLPEPGPTPRWSPPLVKKFELESGLTVWLLEQDTLPLVSVKVVLPLGSASDPKGKEGLTTLTADLLDEGAGKRSALELSDTLGTLATDYSASAGLDYVLLSMNALSDNFDASMALLADIVLRPQLSAAEFDRRKKQHLAEALAAQSEPGSRLKVAAHRVMFGDGYASAPQEGTATTLEKLRLADVKVHAKQLTRAAGAHLVFAGQVSEDAVRQTLAAHFADWTGARTPTEFRPGNPLPGKTAYVVDFKGAPQSALAVVRSSGDAHDPLYFDELVMNEKFAGSFTGRINMNLREDKGYTYGAFGYFRRYDHAGFFAIQSNVVSEKTAASVREIFAEVTDLCGKRPLSETEVREAKDGLLLGYPMEFSRVDSLGMKLASLPIYGRPADFWTTWPTQVAKVDLTAARTAATPYCDADSYRVVIAGDLAAIKPGLEEMGLTVTELDRDGQVVTKD